MRSVFALIIAVALLLISWKKDEERIPEKDMLVGKWRETRSLYITNNGEVLYESENERDECFSRTIEILSDGRSNYQWRCDSENRPGTFTYNKNEKEIQLNYNTGYPDVFRIYCLSPDELWIYNGRVDIKYRKEKDTVFTISLLTKI